MVSNERHNGGEEVMVIIDSNALIHRAYHALPPLKTKQGNLVNAVYGFILILFKTINDFHPEYMAATFDFPAPTFRHIKSATYKAKRVKTPIDLIEQIPLIKEVLTAFHIPIYEQKGYEADDLIGTIATYGKKQLSAKGKIFLVSGDYDLLQLVNEKVSAYILSRGVKNANLFDKDAVVKKYSGLTPEQLIDYKALRGDQSDNISGVKGVGEKTAIDIIRKYNTLDNVYRAIESNDNTKIQIRESVIKLLLAQKEQALSSRYLSEIECNVPISFEINDLKWRGYNQEEVEALLTRLAFHSLIKKLNLGNQSIKSKQPKLI
ncbi:MAG: 5'-3' exonuclease H3TH domain-containing protein [bacterium]